MANAASNNAGLMRRIVQLEAEKSELQRDIETLCMQQTGNSRSNDVVPRTQTRSSPSSEVDVLCTAVSKAAISRSSASMDCQRLTDEGVLDQTTSQEAEACKQKSAVHAKESLSLQEELAEAYRAKGKVADAFKTTMDKNKELEKEVKYYQSRMAAAFCERDKASLEVDKLQIAERSMTREMGNLRRSLEDMREQCHAQEQSHAELQESMKVAAVECQRAQEVVDKFWRLRGGSGENGNLRDESRDIANILLEDLDENWSFSLVHDTTLEDSYRETELALEELREEFALSKAASARFEEELSLAQVTESRLVNELALIVSDCAKVKEDLEISINLSSRLEEELRVTKAIVTEESHARKEAERKHLTRFDQLESRRSSIEAECDRLRNQQAALKTMVSTFVEEGKGQSLLVVECVEKLLGRVNAAELKEKNDLSVEEGSLREENSVEASASQDLDVGTAEDVSVKQQSILNVLEDDSKHILAQALQEKVEALLLLSQQEERYLLEAATQSALESEIRSLKQKLAQVTGEKVIALMELADEREQLQHLRDRERDLLKRLESGVPSTPGFNGASPAVEGASPAKMKQKVTNSGYIKGWWRGLDLPSFKTVTSANHTSSGLASLTPSGQSGGNNSIGRLLIENAALHERVASVEYLAVSANRLRMLLSKVAAEAQGELAPPEIRSALEIIDSVKSEAENLAATPGSALPISFQSPLENSSEVPPSAPLLEGMSKSTPETEGASRQDHDAVYKIGLEIAELLLALAEVHTESLVTRLNLASID